MSHFTILRDPYYGEWVVIATNTSSGTIDVHLYPDFQRNRLLAESIVLYLELMEQQAEEEEKERRQERATL